MSYSQHRFEVRICSEEAEDSQCVDPTLLRVEDLALHPVRCRVIGLVRKQEKKEKAKDIEIELA